MAWITPKTDRVAGSRTTYEDLNRICNNLIEMGCVLSKSTYTSDDIVTNENWEEIIGFVKSGNPLVTNSTRYDNLNLLEGSIENATGHLCFTAEESTTIRFWKSSQASLPTLKYCTNGSTWNDYTFGANITLSEGDKCWFKGDNATFVDVKFSATGNVAASGNIMSLLDSTLQLLTVPQYAFKGLFLNCTKLTEAPRLPATTVKACGYEEMFAGCTGIIKAPELPATRLNNYCYHQMFSGCTGLTEPPSTIPATTAYYGCCEEMFMECSNLTEAPELPANTLDYDCYKNMFCDCTSLAEAPELPAMNLNYYCYEGMFAGCTSLEASPSLPAEELFDGCYQYMFAFCSSLVTVPNLPPAYISAFDEMFKSCSSLKAYSTSGEGHSHEWKITGNCSQENMLLGTIGDYTSVGTIQPPITIYTQNEPV